MNSVDAGNRAERAVADILEQDGYRVNELNWKTAYAEIDIVAQKNGAVFFVEVKYRKTVFAGDGFDYITPKKLQHMTRAAEAWVLTNNWDGPYELLGASVTGGPDKFDIDIREIA